MKSNPSSRAFLTLEQLPKVASLCPVVLRVLSPTLLALTVLFCFNFKCLAQTNMLINSDFENGTSSWNITSPVQWFLWSSGNQGHNNSSKYVYLGADAGGSTVVNNGNCSLYQTVTIPSNATVLNLSYWVKITSDDLTAANHDYMFVEIRDTSNNILYNARTYTNTDSPTAGWILDSPSLPSAYAGQTIRLAFHGVTDANTKTVFRVDDVSLAALATKPDLSRSSDNLNNTSPHAGNTVTASLTIQNPTVVPAGAFHVGFYWGTNSSFSNVSPFYEAPVSGCTANGTVPLIQNIIISASTAPGTYYLGYKIDDQNEVSEANENNNGINFWVVTVSATPADLVPQNIVVTPDPATIGGAATISYTIGNTGGTSAPASHTKVQIKNASGVLLTQQTFSTAGIAANSSAIESRSMSLAGASAGTYYAYVTVDNNSEVVQGNYSNDVSGGFSFAVQAPSVPSVTTLAASSIGTTSAVLNGRVTSDGGSLITERRFDWGLTLDGAWPTSNWTNSVSVNGSDFSFTLGNLTANTTYYFRSWAHNSSTADVGYGQGWNVGSITLLKTAAATAGNASISDAWWSNAIDNDGDGYKRSARLNWNPDVVGSSSSVMEKIYFKLGSSNTWTYLTTTAPHSVSGTTNSDQQYLDVYGSDRSRGPYDWRIEIYRVGQASPDYTRDSANDGDLSSYALEPSAEDVFTSKPTARLLDPGLVHLDTDHDFSASISVPVSDRPITSYVWRFSDTVGQTPPSSENHIVHRFLTGKDGWVEVTVSDGVASDTLRIYFALQGIGNPKDSGKSLDPVNSAIGNFIMNPTLMEVAARRLPFVFQAFYNSKAFDPTDANPDAGSLGFGWTHNFEINARSRGTEDGVRYVIIGFGDGHKEKYRLINATWTPAPGIYNKVVEAADGSFTLTSPNQIKTQFDPQGNLTSISDRNSNTLSVVWSTTPSRITSVILPGGPDANGHPRKIDFAYDAAGHLSKLTDPINRTVEFTVDAAHNLTAIKNTRGYSSIYTYDELHQMLTGTDPRTNRFVRNVYQGRVVSEQYDADDHKTIFEYPFTPGSTINFTRITREAANGNEITEDHHNAKLQLLERKIWLNATTSLSAKSEYYDNGDRKAVIDRNGNRTEFEYIDGDVTKITFADTSTISLTYSPYHDLLTKTNQLGIIEKREYDDPVKGNLVALTFPFDPAHPDDYKRSFTVDAFGQTTAATDANGYTTHAYFNEWGEIWKVEDAETPPNAKVFDLDGIGRKTGVTDERGSHTTFTLNQNGGAEVTTFPTLPAPIGVTQIRQTFDENDNLTSIEDPLHRFTRTEFDNQDRPYKVKNHNLATITTEFDELGRSVRVQDPKLHYSHRVYDLAGRLTEARDQMGRKHIFTHDANGNVLTDIDDDGVKIETVWDEMNRPIKQRRYTSPTAYDETITHYNLLGQIDWTEDAASHVNHNRTYFYYNDAGQLIRLVEPAINGTAQEFTWTYGFEGNLLSATHPTPTGPKTRYQTWTARNQIATRTDENGQIERYFYNPVGKLDHFINANGQTIAYIYDALNRTTTIDYPGSAVDTQFTYDAAGQLIFMDDALGRTSWTYTTLGQIETVTDPFGKALAYRYDVNGNRDRVTYPGDKVAHYAFDDANALLSVTDWQTRTISRALTAAGRVATITYPNGITTTVGHDAAGRENDIKHQKGVAVPFIHFGYSFDPKGQIQEVSPTIHPLPKQAFTAATSAYTYDAANQLASIDSITVTHDNQGNLLTGKLSPLSTGTDTLTWDIEGRLTSSTIAGVTSTSSYDGQGHRLQTTHGSTTTRHVMDTTGSLAQVMAETDGSGTVTAYYLYLGGLAARILPNGDLSCYHTDRAGNVLALTDSVGSTTDLYQYDEFGVPAGSSGSSQNPFRYAGGFGVQTDANGTLFSRARVYHPDLGRFLSRDALFGSQQNGQSLNRYAAFLNDPISNSDPSGFVTAHAVNPSFYTDFKDAFMREIQEYGTGFKQGALWSIDTKDLPEGSLVSRSIGAASGLVISVADGAILLVEKGAAKILATRIAGELEEKGTSSLLRFFYDPRNFKSEISPSYWAARGPAEGSSLHHWLIPQRATWAPEGIRNAGWNLLELPSFKGVFHPTLGLNQWMGFARNWGASNALKASAVENGIRVAIPGSIGAAIYGGYEYSK